MPRADNLSSSTQLIKGLVMGFEKSGKSDWAARAAMAGFNVLYLDGDVAAATIAQLPVEARKRIFYLDFADNFAGGKEDTRMINLMFEFFTRSEEHTSELQSLMRISYAVLWLKKKKNKKHTEQPSCLNIAKSWTPADIAATCAETNSK